MKINYGNEAASTASTCHLMPLNLPPPTPHTQPRPPSSHFQPLPSPFSPSPLLLPPLHSLLPLPIPHQVLPSPYLIPLSLSQCPNAAPLHLLFLSYPPSIPHLHNLPLPLPLPQSRPLPLSHLCPAPPSPPSMQKGSPDDSRPRHPPPRLTLTTTPIHNPTPAPPDGSSSIHSPPGHQSVFATSFLRFSSYQFVSFSVLTVSLQSLTLRQQQLVPRPVPSFITLLLTNTSSSILFLFTFPLLIVFYHFYPCFFLLSLFLLTPFFLIFFFSLSSPFESSHSSLPALATHQNEPHTYTSTHTNRT